MSRLRTVRTRVPDHIVDSAVLEEVTKGWFAGDDESRRKYLRLVTAAGVESRRFILPPEQTLAIGGLANRAELFEEHGVRLLGEVLQDAVEASEIPAGEFSHLVFTSCSVPSIPSIDAAAAEQAGLSRSIGRVPMFQQGCAGGVVGLSLASALSAGGRPVVLGCAELCSLVFHPEEKSGEQMVGAAIFGDGAAAAVITPEVDGVQIRGTQSFLVPHSRNLMGYRLADDGFYLRLDRELPRALENFAPDFTAGFLARYGLVPEQIDHWLIHPGSRKILDALGECFSLRREQCRWSYEVLSEFGNLSSATILFILHRFLESDSFTKGSRSLIVGIGPGLTYELILLER